MKINVGDKFVVTNKMWFLNEGDVVRVTNVDHSANMVSFAFEENPESTGFMDFESFGNHFKKMEEEKEEVMHITKEYIESVMAKCEFEVMTVFDRCTVVTCKMPSGFIIVENACFSAEKYNEEKGIDDCLDKIANKIWELEYYALQQRLYDIDSIEECDCGCRDCILNEENDDGDESAE